MSSAQQPAFAAGLSLLHETDAAVADLANRIANGLGQAPDLLFVFVSHHHGPNFDTVRSQLLHRTGARQLIGCTGESIVGDHREIEGAPAIAAMAAILPGTAITAARLEFDSRADGGSFVGLPDELVDGWPECATMFVFGEPWSFPADALLDRLQGDGQKPHVLGGMASGGTKPGDNALFLANETFDAGAVAVLLSGDIVIDPVVSQGCRPIGRHFVITKADRNVIFELGGKPPLAQFQEIFESLAPDEQQLARQGLHVGRVVNEYQSHFERGDFLLRNVIGADRESGAIAIGDFVRPGQTVQFHIRDAASADEDLRLLLDRYAKLRLEPLAGLLFTCNGRGSRLFRDRDHDAAAVRKALGEVPLAGFFAQGEIGPIGGTSFLHGFTASIGLFRRRNRD